MLAPDNRRHEAQARHQPYPASYKCRIRVHTDTIGHLTVLLLPFLIAFLMRDFFSSGVRASHVLRIKLVALRFGPPFRSSEEDSSLTIVLYPFHAFSGECKLRLGSPSFYRALASRASVLLAIFLIGSEQNKRDRQTLSCRNWETSIGGTGRMQ